jgi:N,N'-diacetyllegionaminate synthase
MKKNGVFIIAEAGVNHNGSIDIAKKLIDEAKKAGADAVKFQTFKAEKLVSKIAPKAEYQKKTTSVKESQFEMIKRLELNKNDHIELIKYCKNKKIDFLSSPFDLDSIDLLNSFGLRIFKIPSGEIINLPYLRKIGKLNKEIILSTGMSCLSDIEFSLKILTESGTKRDKITVLHCNTEYPTPYKDVNLNAMITIRNAFKIEVGYSDHTPGIEIPIAAVALGAKIIEKHFTLDKNMEGPDHKASLGPGELKQMIDSIRNIELALGNGVKVPSESEKPNMLIGRKSIVAKRNIEKGEIFSNNNITVKRPGSGISPMRWDEIIGKKSPSKFKEDELIKL